MICLVFFSCDKYKAKKFSGVYSCSVNYHYSDMSGLTNDTVYAEDVEVKEDGDSIIIFNNKIHVDALRKGVTYEKFTGASTFYQVKIDNDELYYFSTNGGLGGSSSIEYLGKKKS